MTSIANGGTITANGDYVFPVRASTARVPLEVDGTFGGGTVTPGYQGLSGAFVPHRDSAGAIITTTNPATWEVFVPLSGLLAIRVAGATTPALVVGRG